jgi:ribonuclease VapC
MIVDTSALVAAVRMERGGEQLLAAFDSGSGFIPAPVLVEFTRVTEFTDNLADVRAAEFVATLLKGSFKIYPFDEAAAQFAASANAAYGSGNGKGGKLNMLDLMVYGTARALDMPILCTGRDFAATDAAIHAASRPD